MSSLWRLALYASITGALLWASPTHAGTLSFVSDTISTSAPGTSTVSHVIRFTTAAAIPASGKIIVAPESGAYTIPLGFDYTDADLSMSTGGPYTERTLAASASATEDGVSVSDSVLTITLNSTSGVSAGAQVMIELGEVATTGALGDVTLTNYGTVGSYPITITTTDSSSVQIDRAQTMIVIIEPVSVVGTSAASPPNRLNGFPSGTVVADNTNIEISLNTDEPASCRYATTTDVSYYDMTNGFIAWSSSTIHHVNLSGFQNSATYSYYVRCEDPNGFANFDDFEITFSVDADPEYDSSVSAGDAGPGGVGPYLGGSAYLYQSTVTISGSASPNSTISVLKDGSIVATTQTKSDGSFTVTSPSFERGTYSFMTYVTDRARRRSSSYTSTMAFAQGTNNTISNIVIPPTIALEDDSVGTSDEVVVSGEAVPGATIDLLIDGAVKYSASSTKSVAGSADGLWKISFNASQLSRGTHLLRARAIVPGRTQSGVSTVLMLGVGEEPSPASLRTADLNRDGKVNLVDFSILLSKWQSDDEVADINADGTVNIADFSIMLFQWTG